MGRVGEIDAGGAVFGTEGMGKLLVRDHNDAGL